MNIKCQHCHTRYRFDEAVLKGAKGALVRCRRCGNSILVLIPGETDSEISVFHSMVSSQNLAEGDRTAPVVSSAKEKLSPPPDVGKGIPDGEWERPTEKNPEEGKASWKGISAKLPPIAMPDHKTSIFFPPAPKSPTKVRQRRLFRWSPFFP